MKCCIDTHDAIKAFLPEQELTEEQFLEQFAALEDSLSLLQLQMRGMSENVRLFGSFARRMRQSTCPTSGKHRTAIGFDGGYPETAAEVVQSKASYRHSK
ncbi:hypothetical protein [Bradyrhizobium sp. Tv2a-2]|uniref:hypothetical protein n=1 Tax=Bradyrhizobium sp. Tv2a-2 TaxID=113395 RepID=UPI000466A571|nr:hypothetical protein [Bradyrhizobium sp. Tv2a-2]